MIVLWGPEHSLDKHPKGIGLLGKTKRTKETGRVGGGEEVSFLRDGTGQERGGVKLKLREVMTVFEDILKEGSFQYVVGNSKYMILSPPRQFTRQRNSRYQHQYEQPTQLEQQTRKQLSFLR